MKLAFVPILMAGMTIPSLTDASASLADSWHLEEPLFNYSNKVFTLDYTFSESIKVDLNTKATLYFYKDTDFNGDRNCKSEANGDANKYLSGIGLTLNQGTIEDVADADAEHKVGHHEEVTITLNTGVIDQDLDVFFKGDGESSIKFCVRFGLCTGDCDDVDNADSGVYEVNFLESLVELVVDLRGEFTVDGISVAPKKKLKRTANQEYGLEAFQCSGKTIADGGTRYVPKESAPSFNQGDVITVCVQPDVTALADNIFMKKVEYFKYSLVGSSVNQEAINIAEECAAGDNDCDGARFGLTEIDKCTGEKACVIKTILFATFYQAEGSVAGAGTATMQFGTTGSDGVVRKLRGADERQLQAEDVAAAGEFDVNFKINSNDTFQSASGASSSMSILALVGSAAAALML